MCLKNSHASRVTCHLKEKIYRKFTKYTTALFKTVTPGTDEKSTKLLTLSCYLYAVLRYYFSFVKEESSKPVSSILLNETKIKLKFYNLKPMTKSYIVIMLANASLLSFYRLM